MKTPDYCPVCGEGLSPKAKACPECGADDRSGWKEDELMYDGLDLPDEAWGEAPDPDANTPRGTPLIWKITGVLLVLAFFYWMFGGLF